MSCGCACLWLIAKGLAVAGNKEKSDSSTTHAAVSDGTIIINDTAKQQQNVDDLSRDVAHANQTLSPIFDKEKEQQRMQTLQLIGEIGNQAADIARTQGDIAGFTAAKAKYPTYTDDQLRETVEFKKASEPFGTGGDIQRAITASTAAIQGLAGGDIAKALAGGAAPYLATVIKKTVGEDNKAANLMAHAVVNAALSLARGENALAGASSAATAEAVGMISKAYYGKDASELDESQKQTISALASLAAGLAGGLVGGDTASAVSGMQTGKVTVENNFLGNTSSEKLDGARDKLLSGDKSKEAALNLLTLENADKRSDVLLDRFVRDPSLLSSADKQELQTYLQVYAYEMSREYGTDMAQELVKGLLSGNDYLKHSPDNELQRKAQNILAGWSIQESQAAVGTPALLALSGPIGATLRAATASGGAYQFGTGVGQMIEGDDTWAAAGNMASGALAMSAVGFKPGGAGSANKRTTTAKTPDGISFNIDQPAHLSAVEKYTQQKGITGGHNADAFYSAANQNGVKIVSENPTGIPGVTEIKYQIPAKDRAGNITGYKDKPLTKTIYDPKIVSDQKILELGQQAAANGYKSAIASGAREYTNSAGGISFRVYLDPKTGTVTNFFPVTK